jgi:hypothetical protein
LQPETAYSIKAQARAYTRRSCAAQKILLFPLGNFEKILYYSPS